MPKIYPDTNWFVDFYQAALDSIDVFAQLDTFKGNFVLTEQTVNEFRRNRVRTLKSLAAQFKKTLQVSTPHTTSVLRALPGHAELTKLFGAYKKKGEEVLTYLELLIEDESKDPVAQKFMAFASDPNVTTLRLNDAAITAAWKRKLLGNPPSSPDKYSAGDEIIWELLTAEMQDDLIVLTRDHTFHENQSLLNEEFLRRTGRRLILVTGKLTEALKRIGEEPTAELIEIEKQEAKRAVFQALRDFPEERIGGMLTREVCPACSAKGDIRRFQGSEGDAMVWFECARCGLFLDITGM